MRAALSTKTVLPPEETRGKMNGDLPTSQSRGRHEERIEELGAGHTFMLRPRAPGELKNDTNMKHVEKQQFWLLKALLVDERHASFA